MAEHTLQHRTPLDHDVLRDLKVLVEAGQVEALVVRDDHGRTLMHVPVDRDAGAETLAPVWAALGAVAAGGLDCTVEARMRAGAGDRPG
jgi:hypothetical protein